ncbi:MAG TPA: hypothetical protein VFJ98_04235 [Mycobacteriales bacterium]|nr:hypothetical protein [Mycobacteriales bacterium]
MPVALSVVGLVTAALVVPAGAATPDFDLRYAWQPSTTWDVGAATMTAQGDVYVLDETDQLVQRFTYAGELVQTIGAGAGSGDGQLSGASALAVSDDGHVFVADTGNNRVVEFAPGGAFVTSWDAAAPIAIDTDGTSMVWVVSDGSPGAAAYDFTGEVQPTFANGNAAAHDAFATQTIQGVGVDRRTGTVYLTDVNGSNTSDPTSEVLAFTASGLYLGAFGSTGTGRGQLLTPTLVTVLADGDVAVADPPNSRVEVFHPDGSVVRSFGPYRTGPVGSAGLGSDCRGNILASVADQPSAGDVSLGVFGNPTAPTGPCPQPKGRMLATATSGPAHVVAPAGVAVDRAGNVYVSDLDGDAVVKYDALGHYITRWGSSGAGHGQFNQPAQVAVDKSGNVYVADTQNHRVQEFTAAGRFLRTFGSAGTGNGRFTNLTAVGVDSAGHVMAGDFTNSGGRLEVFSATGTFQRVVPLTVPDVSTSIVVGIGVDSQHRFLVAVDDVQLADPPSLLTVTAAGDVTRTVALPSRAGSGVPSIGTLAVGPVGLANGGVALAVQDVRSDSPTFGDATPTDGIMRLDGAGNYVSRSGATGTAAGMFTSPSSIAVDCRGDLFVAEKSRIQQVGLPAKPCRWLPVATTGGVTKTSRTGTTLTGKANPSAQVSRAWFQWGTSTRYTRTTRVVTLVSDNVTHALRAVITGLRARHTYHYRLVVQNASGRVLGKDRTFRTAG